MKNNKKLTMDGIVQTNGRLIVVDPCYLDDFDMHTLDKIDYEFQTQISKKKAWMLFMQTMAAYGQWQRQAKA